MGARVLHFVEILLLLLPSSLAKTTMGDFTLSGLNTEYVLGSFAVGAGKMGHMKAEFRSKEPYQMNKDLHVRLIEDDKWRKFQNAPSCTEKVPYSSINEHVVQQKKSKKYQADIVMPLNNEKGTRPRYYYFVITDCSLEFYMHDGSIPKVHFVLETWNDGSHVSADEEHLKMMHTITLLISLLIGTLLGLGVLIQLYEKSSVHAAMFWVLAAAVSDAMSSITEVIHLSLYAGNGVGSYFLDALSAHFEAICDSLIVLLLLSVAAGWTLPSDVVRVQQNASFVQKALDGLHSPFGALQSLSATTYLAVGIMVVHILMAQWGRVYNDDFDSYHDLEHLPGKLLMFMRLVLGFIFVGSCAQTRLRCPNSLHSFYVKFAIVGGIWFWSLPVLTWIVNTMVSYHLRHFTVGVWGAATQSASIVLLSWLVTSHSTAYHKLSHMSTAKETLMDSLSSTSSNEPKSFSMLMGHAKVRLD
eukprot:scaffold2551_cov113-Cylindrotheca_fusiformis.AAC.31